MTLFKVTHCPKSWIIIRYGYDAILVCEQWRGYWTPKHYTAYPLDWVMHP